MEKVIVFWAGTSKSGDGSYIGVKYFVGDFAVKKFIEVRDHTKYGAGEEIEVPREVLQ